MGGSKKRGFAGAALRRGVWGGWLLQVEGLPEREGSVQEGEIEEGIPTMLWWKWLGVVRRRLNRGRRHYGNAAAPSTCHEKSPSTACGREKT